MVREEIANGIYYTGINREYKRNRISVHLQIPLERENLTATALLPYLLERGCSMFPDMTMLKRRLGMLFGSSLNISAGTMDYARMLSLNIDGVDERYLGEDSIASGRADLLLDILFNPIVENNSFREDWIAIEKEKLRLLIMSEINDKRAYCLKKATELFFENDARALPQNGFAEEIDALDGEGLYEVYRSILSSAKAEIVCVGSDNDDVKKRFSNAFSVNERFPENIAGKKAVGYSDERTGEMSFDVEQDKFAMILTAGRLLSEREQSVFRIANMILGASPTSRLFMNVREKQSLCYYCSSRPGYMTGALTIDSGIEGSDVSKLKQAVLREIEEMAGGNISDKEIDEAKLMMKSALLSVADSPEGLTGWYLNSLYRLGKYIEPEKEIEITGSVTKKEITDLMGLFKTSATMHLRKEE